jgi:hypothetical protein
MVNLTINKIKNYQNNKKQINKKEHLNYFQKKKIINQAKK